MSKGRTEEWSSSCSYCLKCLAVDVEGSGLSEAGTGGKDECSSHKRLSVHISSLCVPQRTVIKIKRYVSSGQNVYLFQLKLK